jgi:hypothetical protein
MTYASPRSYSLLSNPRQLSFACERRSALRNATCAASLTYTYAICRLFPRRQRLPVLYLPPNWYPWFNARERGSSAAGMSSVHRPLYNPRTSRLRIWILNIHLYAGLAPGLVITLVGLTGSFIVYKPETERLLSSRMAVVQPLSGTVSVEELYAQAHAFRPADRIDRLYT